MKAVEIFNYLYALSGVTLTKTQDVCKAGDPEREVKKIATTMFPTVKVLKETLAWGADLLIVHEPIYFNHCDEHSDEAVEMAKRALIEKSGLTIYRYHDYSHCVIPDVIAKGVVDKIAFKGEIEYNDYLTATIKLQKAQTAKEMGQVLKERLQLQNIRLCGNCDFKTQNVVFIPGAAGWGRLKNDNNTIFIMGEICEWAYAEYVRDAAELGWRKALIILGHGGSEREGMRYTAQLLKDKFQDIDIRYFETEEAFFPL